MADDLCPRCGHKHHSCCGQSHWPCDKSPQYGGTCECTYYDERMPKIDLESMKIYLPPPILLTINEKEARVIQRLLDYVADECSLDDESYELDDKITEFLVKIDDSKKEKKEKGKES